MAAKQNSLTPHLFAIMAAFGLANIAMGMMFQVIPQAMAAQGHSLFLIGLNGFVGQVGVLLMALSLTQLRRHFNSHHIVMLGMSVLIIGFGCFYATDPVWWWFPIRFVACVAMASVFTTGETWLQNLAGDQGRGRVMGAYMTCQTITFALGPLLIPYVGTQGITPWAACIITMAAALALVSRLHIQEFAVKQVPAGLWKTFGQGKFLFLCIAAATLFDGVMVNFFVLYAKDSGMDTGMANQLFSFSLAMCMFFFFAIGWLGDHWSRHGMILICAVIQIVSSIATFALINTDWVWPLSVIQRAAAFGVYLCGLGLLGDQFKGTALVAAVSVVSLLWGICAGIAPALAGWLFDRFGIEVLPWLVAAFYMPVIIAWPLNLYVARGASPSND